MEHTPNEEQLEVERKPRRRSKKLRLSIPIPAFLTRIGEDVKWYYDIRLWSPVIVVVLLIAIFAGRGEKAPVEVVPETTAPVLQEETAPTEEAIDPEAAALARLAESVGMGRSDNVKTIIMWIAINRSEDRSNGYGQSIIDEIARPNQWQGYDENIAYTKGTYEIAKSVLNTQKTEGLRPLDQDMLWLVLNDDGSVSVRNRYIVTQNVKVNEKTIK